MQHLLADVKSWAVFQQIVATLGPRSKGDLFELLTKHYLLFSPTYNTTLSDVWLLDEVPEKLRASLRLPQGDQGIDLIARTKAGGFGQSNANIAPARTDHLLGVRSRPSWVLRSAFSRD